MLYHERKGALTLAQNEIIYIESILGWKLGAIGIERATQLKQLGASLDEIAEAIALL